MISWQPNIERESLSEHVDCGSLCSSMRREVKSVWYYYMRRQELDNTTFSSQFPLNAVISHLRKTVQSSLSTVLLIDLFPGCQVLTLSWHVCSSLFIPPCLCACVSVWMCVCSAVSGHLERHQSDSPIPSKRPSSRSETSESPLSSKRPRTAEKKAAEQVSVFVNIDAFRCS